jgi:hypothetical protein
MHSPWIVNCVGLHNYKYFYLFLLYACVGCWMYPIAAADTLSMIGSSGHVRGVGVGGLLAAIITVAFGVTLSCFVGFHTHLVLTGTTTLENHFSIDAMEDLRGQAGHLERKAQQQGLPPARHRPARKTGYENWCTVFGNDKWRWFLPVKSTYLTGYETDVVVEAKKRHRTQRGLLLNSSGDGYSSEEEILGSDDGLAPGIIIE